MENWKTQALFDLSHTLAAAYLKEFAYPWQALGGIRDMIAALGAQLPAEEYEERSPQVWVAKSAKVYPSAYLGAPCIIGPRTEVRHCAFVRSAALIGADCVVGNSVEIKNAILFDGTQVPHYNYVGDSILGYRAHMGAGSITSNVKGDRSNVCLRIGQERLETGLRKFGAMLGDGAEIGCNSVLNPGTLVGRGARVYPLSSVRGAVPAHSIYKMSGDIVAMEDR